MWSYSVLSHPQSECRAVTFLCFFLFQSFTENDKHIRVLVLSTCWQNVVQLHSGTCSISSPDQNTFISGQRFSCSSEKCNETKYLRHPSLTHPEAQKRKSKKQLLDNNNDSYVVQPIKTEHVLHVRDESVEAQQSSLVQTVFEPFRFIHFKHKHVVDDSMDSCKNTAQNELRIVEYLSFIMPHKQTRQFHHNSEK